MPAFLPLLNSLRRKVVFGYGLVVAAVVGLSAFSLIEMRMLERQIAAGEGIDQFLGIILEIRRFEKNYFLYRERADLDENLVYVAQARTLLETQGDAFSGLGGPAGLHAMRTLLEHYAALVTTTADPAQIRQLGKEITTVAEGWTHTERVQLQAQLDRHRQRLLVAIAAVVLLVVIGGQALAWRITRPLKALEGDMAAVADGRRAKLELAASDSEIVSLTQAFNHVLQELETRQGQLLRSEKLAALGTLLSGVAHELNNPLSNISTSCEILKEEVGAGRMKCPEWGTAFESELLQQIDTETWRARRIVRSLLDYARDQPFRREAVALEALVEESLRLIRGRIPVQIDIQRDIPAQLVIAGDRQRLQQVVFNLVGNALDALEGAGTLHITARQESSRGIIVLEIGDNGHGIPPDILPRIFDPFFTTKEVGQGLGLGLFIVHEIVEEHGGSITVTSTPASGTTFRIQLPAQDIPP